MDKESHNNHNISSVRDRDHKGGDGSLLLRASSDTIRQTTSSELVLQWGNRKRPRCMKFQVKVDDSSNPVQRTTVRVDRRVVVRTDKDSSNHHQLTTSVINNSNHSHNHYQNHHNNTTTHQSNGYPNLRQRPASPQQRVLRILCGSGCGIHVCHEIWCRGSDYMR